jgi:nitroreductase/ubiquinone/menaquinone biosynthesis C-methylase UbiE
MDLQTAIRERRSTRRFQSKEVEDYKIFKLINAAQWAPSACNKQVWEFVVVKDKKIKQRLVNEAGAISFLRESPVAIYVLYPKDVNPENYANIQSASAAIENILLTAHEIGIGAVWVGACGERDKVRKILNIPKGYLVVAAVFLGYPKERLPPPPRRKINDIIHMNKCSFKDEKYSNIYPHNWTLKMMKDFRMRGIRSTSPFPKAHMPRFKMEFEREIELSIKELEKQEKILDVLSFSGTYPLEILRKNDISKIHILEMAEELTNFIEFRRRNIGLEKEIAYSIGSPYELPYVDQSFDVVTCFKRLEILPEPEKLIKELSRVLKKEGKLILTFWNVMSIYGAYYHFKTKILGRTQVTSHDGPVKPIFRKDINKMLENNGFKIEKVRGINAAPNLEGYTTLGIPRIFCRTVWTLSTRR